MLKPVTWLPMRFRLTVNFRASCTGERIRLFSESPDRLGLQMGDSLNPANNLFKDSSRSRW